MLFFLVTGSESNLCREHLRIRRNKLFTWNMIVCTCRLMLSWSNAVFAGWCSPGCPGTTPVKKSKKHWKWTKTSENEQNKQNYTESSFLEPTLELVGPCMTLGIHQFQLIYRKMSFFEGFLHLVACLLPLVLLVLARVARSVWYQWVISSIS